MSIVLETNVLLRLVTDSADLGDGFKDAVETAVDDGEAAVSAITFVETTRLHHHDRIDLGVHPATTDAAIRSWAIRTRLVRLVDPSA